MRSQTIAAPFRRVALVCAVCGLAALVPPYANPLNASSVRLPDLILWAWERPEDLRGLDRGIGVAFLAQTIRVGANGFDVEPRRQPLRVSPDTALVAVTRIEAEPGSQPDGVDTDRLASTITRTASLPHVVGVQIDFDAVVSERRMYADLLRRARQKLDATVPLSITALASWCADDDWLTGLPVDEVVPMLFRMGPANEAFRTFARSAHHARPACRRAIGTSLDEPIELIRAGRRVYTFNPKAWTAAHVEAARGQLVQ